MVEVTDAELDQEARELLAHLNSVPFEHEYRMEGETFGQILDVLRRLIDDRTALRARIAEDQAQIAALTTYRENLRDEVIELRARIAELEAFQQQAIKQVCELAREAGEAKGKLEASELPGIVDGWREKCERLERRIAELEADRAEWVEVERLRMGKATPPTPPA